MPSRREEPAIPDTTDPDIDTCLRVLAQARAADPAEPRWALVHQAVGQVYRAGRDAARRFAGQPDAADWLGRLHVHGTDLHAVSRVTSGQQIALAGGGGTDMRVGIQSALALRERPGVVIVLTDGLTPWPKEPASCRLIAVLIGSDKRVGTARLGGDGAHRVAGRERSRAWWNGQHAD